MDMELIRMLREKNVSPVRAMEMMEMVLKAFVSTIEHSRGETASCRPNDGSETSSGQTAGPG